LSFTKVQNTEQPTGSYNIQGAFAAGTSNVTTGACLITPTFTYQVVGTCSGLNQGSITIAPNVSTFTPTLNGITYSTNQIVFPNLGTGNYTLFITSNGIPSSTQTINIPSTPQVTLTQSNCEVPITSTSVAPSYTFSATRTYNNIPNEVTITADLKRRFQIRLELINESDLSNYIFTELYTKIYRNGNLIYNITSGAGNPTLGNITSILPANINCYILKNQTNIYEPTPFSPIEIINGDIFTFETNFELSAPSTETLTPLSNCIESIGIQALYLLINVTDDSPSCFSIGPNLPVSQALTVQRNLRTNSNTVSFSNTYSPCP
jgi:hypothetical protein